MTLLIRCALPCAEGRGVSATCLSFPPVQLWLCARPLQLRPEGGDALAAARWRVRRGRALSNGAAPGSPNVRQGHPALAIKAMLLDQHRSRSLLDGLDCLHDDAMLLACVHHLLDAPVPGRQRVLERVCVMPSIARRL